MRRLNASLFNSKKWYIYIYIYWETDIIFHISIFYLFILTWFISKIKKTHLKNKKIKNKKLTPVRTFSLVIYNSCFTAKFGAWALGFCGGVYGKDNLGSIHEGDHQLESVSSLDLLKRCIHNLISKVQALLPSRDSSLFICFILSATIK